MSKKKFTIIRLSIVVVMTVAIGIAVTKGIAFIPPLAMVISAGLILLLMKRVDDVIADERDYRLGGQAARATFNLTVTALTAIGGSLVAYGIKDPYYYRFGYLLLYLVTFMMVVNIIAFLYYQKKGDK